MKDSVVDDTSTERDTSLVNDLRGNLKNNKTDTEYFEHVDDDNEMELVRPLSPKR